jgi:hypothetical protein
MTASPQVYTFSLEATKQLERLFNLVNIHVFCNDSVSDLVKCMSFEASFLFA